MKSDLDFSILYSDGGSRGNPGPAGCGAVLRSIKGSILDHKKKYLGQSTNNVAEYKGLILGLNLARLSKIKSLEIRLDSELIVKQLNGEYKIKNPDLKYLYHQIKKLLINFEITIISHIKRIQNKKADELVNQAINETSQKN